MNFLDDFFVFPQAIAIEGELKLDFAMDNYTLYFRDKSHTISLLQLEADSTTMLLFDEGSESFFQVDNWQKILRHERLSSQQALKLIGRPNFIQIDKYSGRLFTKVFLPNNQFVLASDTHDFTLYSHFSIDYIHPLDWHYQPSIDILAAVVKGNALTLRLDAIPSIFNGSMFLSYGDESVELSAGLNTLNFPYIEGETLHLGNKPHYKGIANSFRIEEYL